MADAKPTRADSARSDMFDQHELEGVKVYVERKETGEEIVWLALYLRGRDQPVGLSLDPAWAESLRANIETAVETLRKSRGSTPTLN